MNKKLLRFPFEALAVIPEDSTAIFRQIENQIREAIWQGRLSAGERLPSTRHLAKQLGVARNTVINAYEQLALEGFIVTRHGQGTHVTTNFPKPANCANTHDSSSKIAINSHHYASRYKTLASQVRSTQPSSSEAAKPFRAHLPNYLEFPKTIWAKLINKRLKQSSSAWMEKIHPCGYEPLRAAIADYLGVSRGLNTTAEQVIISSGAQQAVELLAKLFINTGDVVCFENPGYTHAALAFQLAGAKILTIPVDEDGLNVDELKRTAPTAKIVYVTPAHHFLLCSTLSQARRQALLEWANATGAIIIEDDYNGEYRYQGRLLPTLHAMAREERVIYIGSFSKLLFPALRLGYLVVPHSLIGPLGELRWIVDRHSPALEQIVLADFINQGHFSRHLRKMRMLYAQRQKALVEAAEEHLNGIMKLPALEGGLHLIGWPLEGVSPQEILDAAENASIELMPTSAFNLEATAQTGIIFGYAPYTPEQIRGSIKQLREAYLALKAVD